ncbi:hypothetical protein PCK1_000720 [Pneumocystis canis]|nr:hypothetical protein PCK1_000720 [Pneumocystis canis]
MTRKKDQDAKMGKNGPLSLSGDTGALKTTRSMNTRDIKSEMTSDAEKAMKTAKVALGGIHNKMKKKIRTSATFRRPKTLRLPRKPRYVRKSIAHTPRLDDYKILICPLNTESSMKKIEENNTLVFLVHIRANKHQIKQAFKKLYSVDVQKMDIDVYKRLTLGETGREISVTVNQRALIDKILSRYASEYTLFRELLQNSDDASSRHAEIRYETFNHHLSDGETLMKIEKLLCKRLIFKNDGLLFNEEDWQRIARIAEGNPDEEKIGAFGVGFYSVFSICEGFFPSKMLTKWMG